MKLNYILLILIFFSCQEKKEIKFPENNYILESINAENYTPEEKKEMQIVLKKSKILYDELIHFKDKEDFHIYGYSPSYKYKEWLNRIGELKETPFAKDILIEYGFAVGDVEMLGLEYIKTKGQETEYSQWANERLKNSFENIRDHE